MSFASWRNRKHDSSLRLIPSTVNMGEKEELTKAVLLARQYVAFRVDRYEITDTSAHTMRGVLHRFASAMPADPGKITRRRLEGWLARRGHKVTAGTLRSELSIIRQWLRWLVLNGHASSDPSLGIKGPKEPDYQPRALEHNEVARLLRKVDDPRRRLMILLMVQEGLRCREVAGLTLADIGEGILVVRGKGGKVRHIPMTSATRQQLGEYLRVETIHAGPLFPSPRYPGRPLTARWVSELLSKTMAEAGIKHHAGDGKSAHALRHTCASDILAAGADIRTVQQILGHSALTTTQRYLRLRDAEGLREAMGGRHYSLRAITDQEQAG
jgi:integrase/recombinase XerC